MYLIIIILPFLGSCSSGLFGKFIGHNGSVIITTVCLFLSFLSSFFAFYEVAWRECFVYVKLTPWIDSELLNVDWGFMFDTLTVLMCCVVTFVSTLVHLYSIEYMASDPHLSRFMCYLSLFTFLCLF
jgi:NADH-ubiquinone oxidoreductase chain 5